jgi:hypothetical protein
MAAAATFLDTLLADKTARRRQADNGLFEGGASEPSASSTAAEDSALSAIAQAGQRRAEPPIEAGNTTPTPPAIRAAEANAGLTATDLLSRVLASGGAENPASFATTGTGSSADTGAARTCDCQLCRQMATNALGAQPQPAGTVLASGSAGPLGSSVDLAYTFQLHSNPLASKILYLDFNGHTTTGTAWNSAYGVSSINTAAFDFDGNSSSFSNDELLRIQYIWQRVSEDFSPFNINVTTQDPGIAALTNSGGSDTTWGQRAVIGGSSYDWMKASAGGLSYVNVFGNAYYASSFVFEEQLANGNEKYTAEAISHELGHALGLSHDGTSAEAYYRGQGSGATGWASIMGAGYYQPVTQWSKGEYAGANNKQDDLAILSNSTNKAGYRADDYGSSAASAFQLAGTRFSQFGLITTSSDSDWFRFSTGSGDVSLAISNATQAFLNTGAGFSSTLLAGRSPNLDISASLYRASDLALVATSNPADSLAAAFNLYLNAGTYLLSIDGVGFGDPLTNGYSDYASLGQYLLTGTVVAPPTLLVSQTSLATSEAGGSASFTVKLSQAPTATVVVNLSCSDASEGRLNLGQLSFSTANWNLEQQVVVSGVDDLLVDGSQAFAINLTASSSDANYQGLQGPAIAVANADNDTALPLVLTASQGGLVNGISYSLAPAVVGTVGACNASDDVRLVITEGTATVLSANGRTKSSTSALNGYQWRFDNLVNANQLVFEGYRSANSESDNFVLQLSTDNGLSWSNLLTVSNTTEATISQNLATPLNGTVLVKAIDTNRSANATSRDRLLVDRLVFTGRQTDLRPDLSVTTSVSQAVEDSGGEAVFTVQRGGNTGEALDVAFSLSGTAGAADLTLLDGAGNRLQNTVRIAAGQASATVRLQASNDGVLEGRETVTLTLAAPGDMLKLGSASATAVLVDSITGTPAPFSATTESTISGRLAGTLAATQAADGVIATFSEVLSGSDANPVSQLEQRWGFSGLAGAARFAVKATASRGDDDFRFELSTNQGTSWTGIGTLAGGASGSFAWDLAAPLSGDVLVRVSDTNRTAGASLIDSVGIDAMVFLASTTALPF